LIAIQLKNYLNWHCQQYVQHIILLSEDLSCFFCGFDVGRLSRLAEEIAREEKAQVFAIRVDCSDTRSIKEAFEGVLSLGFVEVLVYNAAYQPYSSHAANFTDIPVNSFEKSLAVSSVGAFHCAQQVIHQLLNWTPSTLF